MSWEVEAHAQVDDVRHGIKTAEVVAADGGTHATIDIRCKDDAQLKASLDVRGVHILDPQGAVARSYDTLHSLLLNENGAFRKAFNTALASQLAALAEADNAGDARR
mmetsp:Transcript_4287/g.14323  ORF Transcript_4287/g.14323 Transcript_4287/m.14323 type:complete len:107 (+) Transcript_4287:62-382(+)